MGHLCGICIIPRWKRRIGSIKGRVVFLGNVVVDQFHDEATFRDMGSSPATLEVAKAVDFYGCLLGHAIEIADGEQAYIQAETQGTPTWICHPHDQPPSWWRTKFPKHEEASM